ncbi:putative hscarg dehydrogenase protein [Botrytis fragariae]|uniref:Putative hscarg dehydrogenase protein n=1 Tax=Botrytis fragariae TaxID=1964551 RepID=A0A8H6AKR9_9HELO|nr:putative hscarg dehydrogenase protein [Botrytis fragariae]KAF5869065.1 putative hscarg dehydrogenase protein [Botrytis fragariae]
MSPVTHTAFIFSATGSQGGALCQQLLDLDWNIHATTRNLASPEARTLRNRGVQFTQSDWDNMDALRNSMSGCEKLFLCLHPTVDDLDHERRQAEEIIKVAKEAGVKQVVASTSLGVSMLGTGIHITPNSFMAKHLAGKKRVEQAVIDGKFEYWTFLHPAFFMANFLEPKVHRYPELRDKGTWTTAMTAEGNFALVDHVDIAKVATAAFQAQKSFTDAQLGWLVNC